MPVNCTLGHGAKIFYSDLVNIYGGETTCSGKDTTGVTVAGNPVRLLKKKL